MDPAHLYGYAAAGFAALTPVALLASRFDHRQLAGEDVWKKPAKFGISLALHFATFALVADCLGDGTVLLAVAWASVGAAVLEVSYIAVQAGRQRWSHFNKDTRVEATIYAMLGIGALLVLSPAVAVGSAAALSPPSAWTPAVKLAVPVGFLMGAALTLLVTLTMGRKNNRYAGPAPAAPRTMRLTGWTLNAADLRPAHFFGTHIMQGLPLIALAASWLLAPTVALVVTVVAAAGWTWFTLALFRRTLKGQPLPGYFAILAQAPRAPALRGSKA